MFILNWRLISWPISNVLDFFQTCCFYPQDANRLALKIPQMEKSISRHQATINVANHSDGVRIILRTHHEAKNATRVRPAERFGTKRSHLMLKPSESIPIKQGDILEMKSSRGASSFAFRLEIAGATSSFAGGDALDVEANVRRARIKTSTLVWLRWFL